MARMARAARLTQTRYWPAKNARSVHQRGRNRACPRRAGNNRSSGQMTNASATRLTPAAHAEATRLTRKALTENPGVAEAAPAPLPGAERGPALIWSLEPADHTDLATCRALPAAAG